MGTDKQRVLCVDDEANVLEGLALHLRRRFDVETAQSGEAGLALLESEGPFVVVLSDMRMPGMNGARFLATVHDRYPTTVRMLLTGMSEFESAVAAVNDGQVFRLLTKPCSPPHLMAAFQAAVEQHRLATSEKVLLEETVSGCIRALTDVLALSSPIAFGRANRAKRHVDELTEKLGIEDCWHISTAALLSQLGCVTLPDETVEKLYYGVELREDEQAMVEKLPETAHQLLASIPRIEPVLETLKQERRPHHGRAGSDIPLGSRLLRIVLDYDMLEARCGSSQVALDAMRSADVYDPDLLEAFAELRGASGTRQEVIEVPIQRVGVGMVFAEDVRLETGVVFVPRGYEVTEGFVHRAKNLRPGFVKKPVRVVVRRG